MTREQTSLHLHGTTELTLIAPVRSGFVGSSEVVSYATRLRRVLTAIFRLRQLRIERDRSEIGGALESMQTIHFTNWAVLSPDDYMPPGAAQAHVGSADGHRLLFTVTFDRSWEEYIHIIVDQAGPLLDLLFSHCEGYEGHTCRHGYENFADWVRRQQVPFHFAYAAAAHATVDDQQYLDRLNQAQQHCKAGSAVRLLSAAEIAARQLTPQPAEVLQAGLTAYSNALTSFFVLREMFPPGPTKPDPMLGPDAFVPLSDQQIFDDALRALVPKAGIEAYERAERGSPITQAMRGSRQRANADLERKQRESEESAPNPEEIQGNLITAYSGMTHGCVVLVHARSPKALRELLKDLKLPVTKESQSGRAVSTLNLALTWAGLLLLDLPEHVREQFPKEFREGMEARAGLIGDVGSPNHPLFWKRPQLAGADVPLSQVHLVLTLQGQPTVRGREEYNWGPNHPLWKRFASLGPLSNEGVVVLAVQPLRRELEGKPKRSREHFGFLDPVSQPIPSLYADRSASDAPREAAGDRVAFGEFLLGYRDNRGETARCATLNPPLFKGSTFMALRKLEQDVAAFEKFASANATVTTSSKQIKALIVGRDSEGDSLTTRPTRENDFHYDDDPAGKRCPLHSHVRRANPRTRLQADAPIPRILRRGFSYGPRFTEDNAGAERGLFFVACNASLAGQFEVIQRWLNGANITGLHSAQSDLLTSTVPPGATTHWIDVDSHPLPVQLPQSPLVRLCWGMYTFVPSLPAIAWLADDARASESELAAAAKRADVGSDLVRRLRAIESAQGPAAARNAWKSVLEETEQREAAGCLWSDLARREGMEPTPYGTLAGRLGHVSAVLSNPGTRYSVKPYGQRMQELFGTELYLGLDAYTTDYDEASRAPNSYIVNIRSDDAERVATKLTTKCLPFIASDALRLRDLATFVLAGVGQQYFATPINPAAPASLGLIRDFVTTSRYIFQPNPEPAVREQAQRSGANIRRAYDENRAALLGSALERHLEQDSYYRGNDARKLTAMIGATSGFAAATLGSLLLVLDLWIESGDFWVLSQEVRRSEDFGLREALFAAMKKVPVQGGLFHRLDREQAPSVDAAEGLCPQARVVVGLGSAAANDTGAEAWRWLFGGSRPGQPHACPGSELAIGAMLGIIRPLLALPNLQRVSQLVLRYDAA